MRRCRLVAAAVLLLFVVGGAWAGPVPSVAPLPGDMLVTTVDAPEDGGGLALTLHMPALGGQETSLYNATVGGDVFRVLFDAVALDERDAILVYGARLVDDGCVLELREYARRTGALQRVLYSAHDPAPDRGHCQPNTFRATPWQPAYDTRHQWLCAIESSNRATLFNPLSRQLVTLHLSDGRIDGSPRGSLGSHLLDTLDVTLHCSAAAADRANNRHLYVALHTQDLLLAVDEAGNVVASTRAVARPRWLHVGAAWLYVLSSASLPDVTLLDPATLAVGASLVLDNPLPGPVGSFYVDEQTATLLLMMPSAGAFQSYWLFTRHHSGTQQTASLHSSLQRRQGVLLDNGQILGGAGGQLATPSHRDIAWYAASDDGAETALAQHCNIQPQHAIAVVPITGRRCALRGQDEPTPMLVVVDEHSYSVYHAGLSALGIHAHRAHDAGETWFDVEHVASPWACAALPVAHLNDTLVKAGHLRVLGNAGALVAFEAALDGNDELLEDIPAYRTIATGGTFVDAAWTPTSDVQELCYATAAATVVCVGRGAAAAVHTTWTLAAPATSMVWDVASHRLLVMLASQQLASLDVDDTAAHRVTSLHAAPSNRTAHVQTGTAGNTPSAHLTYLLPCARRLGVPAAPSGCQEGLVEYTANGGGRWARYVAAANRSSGAVGIHVLNDTWVVARHAEDGIDERTHSAAPSGVFLGFTILVVACLCCFAIVPVVVLARATYRRHKQRRAMDETGMHSRARPRGQGCLPALEWGCMAALSSCALACCGCAVCNRVREPFVDWLEERSERRSRTDNRGAHYRQTDDDDGGLMEMDGGGGGGGGTPPLGAGSDSPLPLSSLMTDSDDAAPPPPPPLPSGVSFDSVPV